MRVIAIALAMAALLGACTDRQPAARHMVADVDALMDVVAGEAARRLPDRYAAVRGEVDRLDAGLGRGEYAAVIAAAPAALADVQQLQAAVTAARDAERARQEAEWAQLAGSLPDQFAAIEQKLQALRADPRRRRSAGVDPDAGERAVRDAVAQWSRGQAAYAAGNLPEALQVAHDVQAREQLIAAGLPH